MFKRLFSGKSYKSCKSCKSYIPWKTRVHPKPIAFPIQNSQDSQDSQSRQTHIKSRRSILIERIESIRMVLYTSTTREHPDTEELLSKLAKTKQELVELDKDEYKYFSDFERREYTRVHFILGLWG